MRLFCLLTVYFFILTAGAQPAASYSQIDRHARKAPPELAANLDSLTQYLVQVAATDSEKVRSFYSWTTAHIRYDQKAYKNDRRRINHSVANILERKKAVCFGYSQLIREFCRRVGIPAEVISGYSKNTPTAKAKMEAPDHAWNAVKVNGNWQLLDATWASSGFDKSDSDNTYFFADPRQFVKDHLPEDPVWQLMDTPLSIGQFQSGSAELPQSTQAAFNFRDSLARFESLSPSKKKISTAFRAYRFNPTSSMAKELSAVILDYESILNKKADRFKEQKQYDSLQLVQLEMIELCDQASSFARLFPNQTENCAYNHINYAVALSSGLEVSDDPQSLSIYRDMLRHFETARDQLKALKANIFIEQALTNCSNSIEYCRKQIRYLTND